VVRLIVILNILSTVVFFSLHFMTVGKHDQSRSVWSTWQRLHDRGAGSAEWSRWRSGAQHWKSDYQQ